MTANKPAVVRIWLVWNCTDIVGTYATQYEALCAQADLQDELCREFGPSRELLASVTISTALLETSVPLTTGGRR